METFLPCEKQINTTVRNRLGKIAHELSDREPIGIEANDEALTPPLTVFLDGVHIRCRTEYQRRHLDVVVGKIESPNMCRRFGPVKEAAASPTQQLRKDLSGLDGMVSVPSPLSPMGSRRCQTSSAMPFKGGCATSSTGGTFRCEFSMLRTPLKGFFKHRTLWVCRSCSSGRRRRRDGVCGTAKSWQPGGVSRYC